MIIDNDSLDKLAYLSRLEFHEHEKEAMLHDLNEMVDWVEQLDELVFEDQDLGLDQFTLLLQANELRQDLAMNAITHERALALAPSGDTNYFRVPSVKG
ncbi:Asp-tRNA(Asn)/Glu-tRNA(Gln) amidotransferase subunit GatC [Cardinium endosymbiont of Culicoides punctatus]|uniref:Asp-tRNA(Asn)/Glu-tRNA(Gln) amidotransferase subunit GatC n=1 Tax=Cardinium endosymbiont of Culicoides punctatus TaxID=2304601 RepID=UPI001058846C|nr:Asp-tRNA(Asn)/Glu-tRNA(Gln) amidotransferase subunit GatC [Cardinium endosymbiont of Culicoides punctatus]TDG95162.1 Aspartyl/glutamyl-tRNA(Asn/Gln) amidotransferase subunit C [Cardinium endosymbiont of Culicoides punctatus]